MHYVCYTKRWLCLWDPLTTFCSAHILLSSVLRRSAQFCSALLSADHIGSYRIISESHRIGANRYRGVWELGSLNSQGGALPKTRQTLFLGGRHYSYI